MTLATFEAADALAAALQAAALPPPKRNDSTITGFIATATPNVGWMMAVNEEGLGGADMEMGEPPVWEVSPGVEIILAIEGEPGPAREGVWRAAVEALAGALFPGGRGLAVAGKFDDLALDGRAVIRRLNPGDAGEPPVILIEVTVSLTLTAPTPFG